MSACIVTFIGSILAMYYYEKITGNMWELWNCIIVLAVMLSGYPLYYLKKWLAKKLISKKYRSQQSKDSDLVKKDESFAK
ncbi:hypothetical protein [Spiroplasma endosymbiont of Stenodema calcarata]|uniref:hypothetical protein n=1 Tax=Spiroplasma endosymbiont of Stenodema calcarata TaxID=3139328 RepID=UPI003CCB68F5